MNMDVYIPQTSFDLEWSIGWQQVEKIVTTGHGIVERANKSIIKLY